MFADKEGFGALSSEVSLMEYSPMKFKTKKDG